MRIELGLTFAVGERLARFKGKAFLEKSKVDGVVGLGTFGQGKLG